MSGMEDIPQSSSTVVGYFANGEDAHRAIHALMDAGFETGQIGAAFHTGPAGSPMTGATTGYAGSITGYAESTGSTGFAGSGTSGRAGASIADAGKEVSYPEMEPSDSGVATTAAGYTANTPAFGAGGGTGMAGAGKPGPITGSDLSHLNLPHEIKSELPHDQPGSFSQSAANVAPGTGSFAEKHAEGESWLDKLGHLFGGRKHTQHTGENLVTDSSQNFGTGEGHLGVVPSTGAAIGSNRRRYSPQAFERSFSGFGVPADHSRHLALRLAQGGAVVTVSVTGRIPEAERIIEANNGTVRFESAAFDSDFPAGDREVAVFGRVEDAYPSYEEVNMQKEPALRDR